jgi:hypothetical protein
MRNTFSSQVKLTFWTDLLLNVISGNCFAFRKIVAFDILIDLETRSHNRPQRERLPCFKTGISVVNKVELAVVTGTGERSPFSGS